MQSDMKRLFFPWKTKKKGSALRASRASFYKRPLRDVIGLKSWGCLKLKRGTKRLRKLNRKQLSINWQVSRQATPTSQPKRVYINSMPGSLDRPENRRQVRSYRGSTQPGRLARSIYICAGRVCTTNIAGRWSNWPRLAFRPPEIFWKNSTKTRDGSARLPLSTSSPRGVRGTARGSLGAGLAWADK